MGNKITIHLSVLIGLAGSIGLSAGEAMAAQSLPNPLHGLCCNGVGTGISGLAPNPYTAFYGGQNCTITESCADSATGGYTVNVGMVCPVPPPNPAPTIWLSSYNLNGCSTNTGTGTGTGTLTRINTGLGTGILTVTATRINTGTGTGTGTGFGTGTLTRINTGLGTGILTMTATRINTGTGTGTGTGFGTGTLTRINTGLDTGILTMTATRINTGTGTGTATKTIINTLKLVCPASISMAGSVPIPAPWAFAPAPPVTPFAVVRARISGVSVFCDYELRDHFSLLGTYSLKTPIPLPYSPSGCVVVGTAVLCN